MGSRREEERNEKIIRGLMKLPPNRRCINCNSLGPQYVCTNFWTFVCMVCSGIHREFTHRVKSVSMAKFTSQEVEALQNGGNQRARETYFTNWDPQRQRLPDSSNANKVREFIKNVYEEKKYAGGKTSDKLPRDSQTHRSSEDVTRRASSYHSYSQSPPYDYQYEERRYGKQASGFTSNKSASERNLYRKASSFFYSPGRFSDHIVEDSFANDGSVSRASDSSFSATQSPNFQRESGLSSPTFSHSKNPSSENLQHQPKNLFPEGQPQRTTSCGSVRSFDSNFMSIKSCNFESEQNTVVTHQDKMSSFPLSSAYGGLDLFNAPAASETDSAKASSIDLFKSPEAPMGPSITFPPSIDLFAAISNQQTNTKSAELSVLKNDGWATFDSPQSIAPPVVDVTSSETSKGGDSPAKLERIVQFNENMPWLPHQSSNFDHPASSMSSPWYEGLCGVPAPVLVPSAQEEAWLYPNKHKSTNPFDLPYDSELEHCNTFLDVSSLEVALPVIQAEPAFLGGASQPLFPLDPAASPPIMHAPVGTQGGFACMVGQGPASQLQNLPAHEHVASIGGNPFA